MFINKRMNIYIIHPARSALHYRALLNWPKYKIIILGFNRNPLSALGHFKLRRAWHICKDIWNWFKLKYLYKNQIIIFSLEPFSEKIQQIKPFLQRHRLIYQTSWSSWQSNDFLFPGTPALRELWFNILKQITVVTVTAQTQHQLQELLEQKTNIHHIPHSVNYELFKNTEKNKSGILFVGRFSAEKNFGFIQKIITAFPQETFTFVGYGEELNKINNYPNVIIKDYVADQKKLAEHFKKAKLLILPSLYELFGLVIIEAMAARTVVISAPNSGPREIIQSGHNGYLIPLELNLWLKTIKNILKSENINLLNSAENDIIYKYNSPIIREKWERLWLKK